MASIFEARYPGECPACGWAIMRGQECRYDEHDEVVHLACPDAEPLRVVGEVCGACFMEKSTTGACGCD